MNYRIIERTVGKGDPIFILQRETYDQRDGSYWKDEKTSADFEELEDYVLSKRVIEKVVRSYQI